MVTDLSNSNLSYEIIIVDNGSTDGTVQWLAQQTAQNQNIKTISLSKNFGTTVSRNKGLSIAQGEYICIADSDIELKEDNTIKRCIESLKLSPKLGLVAPNITYGNGTYQKSIDDFPTLTSKLFRYFNLRALEEAESNDERVQKDVDYAISAFWVFPTSVLAKVGPLDERIFYAPEDIDFCLRIWLEGYRIQYTPSITIVHHAQEISRKSIFSRSMRSHIAGLVYYFFKHGYFFSVRRLRKRISLASQN